jgi:hypothetical protein
MQYIKVMWKHNHADEPIALYSELDDNRWEIRKVEFFRVGSPGYASTTNSSRSTRLGIVPVPELAKIALDPEFEPHQIAREEFEKVWSEAIASRG